MKSFLKGFSTILLIIFVVLGMSNPESTNMELLFQIGLGYVALKSSFYVALFSHKLESLFRVNFFKSAVMHFS